VSTAQQDSILILDFGSQYTQLIARRVRELKTYCEIHPFHAAAEKIRELAPKGIILSGGPASVYGAGAPQIGAELFRSGVPVLGICYGMQLIAHVLGGKVEPSARREYGPAELCPDPASPLFAGLRARTKVWMSHGDRLAGLPPRFKVIGSTDNAPLAAIAGEEIPVYGLQFHPEVRHTDEGPRILENFLYAICGCSGSWTPAAFIEQAVSDIRSQVGGARVLLGLSGGVDSSVAAALLDRAVGKQLTCMLIDNGLLRAGEVERVAEIFRRHHALRLEVVDAAREFLEALAGVTDPEEKRKRIGSKFIEVFERESQRLGQFDFLAQGTIYPDVIESVSVKGPSATIKSHHNVGGLPAQMRFRLVEPLRELFKDEVRRVGETLGLPEDLVWRQPFPGPGLAIRILGEVTPERLALLRRADTLFVEEIKRAGYYRQLWQAFTVLLPVKSVGVMGDERTYEHVAALRAVTSVDAMTADWAYLPQELLGRVANRIINEVQGINRVVLDISSKPPATIEWE